MPLETDKSGGFKFTSTDEVQSGLYPDLFASDIPLWATGQNILFTEVGLEKSAGWETLIDTGNGEPIRGLLQFAEGVSADQASVYAGDLTKLYKIDADATPVTITTHGTGYTLSGDSGSTSWDTGSTTWDAGTTLWDSGVIGADQWSMVNYGTFVLATSGADYPQIRKGYGDFVGMYGGVTGIFLVGGGSGYSVDDVLTLTGGDGSGATAVVLAVSAGVITEVGMTDSGTGFTTVPTGTTSSPGSGATFTFTVSDIDVTSVGVFVNSGPHILGFNTSNSGKEFIWCDADDPDTWVTTPENLAGALQIRELESAIMAVVPLGNRIAVYGDDQLFLVSYLANQLVFGYKPALHGIGAVSKQAVVSVGRKNYGLSYQGFFVTDGASFDYIDEPAIREYFQKNSVRGQLGKTTSYHDEEHNQIRWYFPTSSSDITQGLTYNYKRGTWSIIVNDRSTGDERQILSSPITGSETGIIYREGVGYNADGGAMTAWVRSKGIDVGDADLVKELNSIRIGYKGSGLQFRIGQSETESGTITWGSYTDIAEGFDFENLRTAGRWLYVELYSDTFNAQWEVSSMQFIGRADGTR